MNWVGAEPSLYGKKPYQSIYSDSKPESNMKNLAIVTMELYPLTAGEIGRGVRNILTAMPEADLARTVVIWVGDALSQALVSAEFPDVRFENLDEVAEVQESERYPPKRAYRSTTEWHWLSTCVLRKLLMLEQQGLEFDYIEFPDRGGLAFAATQGKLFAANFSRTTLAVRLYGTEGLIQSGEANQNSKNLLALYDIERKALRDCDRVIAQVMSVADYTRAFYGFDSSEWAPRIAIHAPPLPIDQAPRADSLRISLDTPLLFASPFRWLGAPDLFARACVGFMRLRPEYTGEVHFLAADNSVGIGNYIKKLIPADLAHRFCFHEAAVSPSQREQLISNGVSVFPARFESFCLDAYDASRLGSTVLLNRDNPAFNEETPWRDAENCIKFGGTVDGLVHALQRLFQEMPELVSVAPPLDMFPWLAITESAQSSRLIEEASDAPLVSVVIPNFNLGEYLPYTLRSVAQSSYPNIEVIVCDDASTDLQTRAILEGLAQTPQDNSLKVIYAEYNRGLAGARNLAIQQAMGKYVLTLDADDLISSDFIEKAVGALERNPAYSIVVPQTAYFRQEDNKIPQRQSEFLDFIVFHGEAVACGFFDNRFSTATVLARRSLFDELGYREDMRAWEDWDFYLRAIIAGKRFIVSNELHFFYRKRQGSMISDLGDALHSALCYHDLCRMHTMNLGEVSFPAYVFSTWESTLVEKLQSRINAEKQNAFEQITYRDALITQLQSRIHSLENLSPIESLRKTLKSFINIFSKDGK